MIACAARTGSTMLVRTLRSHPRMIVHGEVWGDNMVGVDGPLGCACEADPAKHEALEAMRFLAPFEPRLVGAVLDGTADEHTAVSLHVHADTVEQVLIFLDDNTIPYDQRTRQLRLDRDRVEDVPVLLFSADGLAFDLTVLSREQLRQAPLDRSGEHPMQRASLAMLEKRLLDEDLDHFDGLPPMPPMRT